MNEAKPDWRTFSSSAPTEAADAADPAAPAAPARAQPVPSVAVLAGVGGLAAGAAVAVVAVLGLGLLSASGGSDGYDEPIDAGLAFVLEGVDAARPTGDIVVDVAGAVVRPGLHRLGAGDRVGDAIEAAGGFGPRADLAAAGQTLNLAQPLDDGSKVLVPELEMSRQGTPAAEDGRIDLNRASQDELESLPGIGPVTARKIMDSRAQRPFAASRDLRSRGLVGESVFDDIKALVRAG